jgi:hypothetical protein
VSGRRRKPAALLLVGAALIFGAAGCGDDDEGDSDVTVPTISVPDTTESTTTDTVETETTETSPDDSGGSGSGSGSGSGGVDSETNDIPPEPGSPQEAFEQDCEQNPAKCG